MTRLQKTLLAITVALLAGLGLYQAHQAAQLSDQARASRQRTMLLGEEIQRLQGDLAAASNHLASLTAKAAGEAGTAAELLRLRGEVDTLRLRLTEAEQSAGPLRQPPLASARAYYGRAGTHSMNHDYEAELADLNRAIELDPQMAEAYFMRGCLYDSNLPERRGGAEKALADYTSCLELTPHDVSALGNRAYVLERLQRYDEAIQGWTDSLRDDTDFSHYGGDKANDRARMHVSRGKLYNQKRDYANAVADFTAALQLDPALEEAHRLRGKSYEAMGDTEKAQQDFAIEPKRP